MLTHEMKRSITLLFCCFLAGCASVGPVQRRAELSRLPEADFRNADVADLIVFLVEHVNRPAPLRVSLGTIQEPDPREAQRRREQFPELYRLCEGKTISLHVKNASLLDILEFAASCADLDVEFRSDQLVVVTMDGKVVMK